MPVAVRYPLAEVGRTRADQEVDAVTHPSITIVIRCFNEERHIGRLLTGVMRQTVRAAQIVIVDSGSTDATLAIASRFPVEITTIDASRFSFGRSLNQGCALARTDLIVIASAHVYPVYDSWLAELVAPFDDPSISLTYGRQVGDETSHFSERQILRRWFPEHSEHPQTHPFCNNANAAVRRSAWEERPYDEELTGLEDIAWAQEAQRLGQSIAYVAEAPVVHLHQERWPQLRDRYRREAIAHRRILQEHPIGPFEAFRLAVSNVASDYVQAARSRELRRNLVSIPWFRSAQFLGTYQGFAQRGAVSSILRRRFYYPDEHRRPDATDPLETGHRIHYEDAPHKTPGGSDR